MRRIATAIEGSKSAIDTNEPRLTESEDVPACTSNVNKAHHQYSPREARPLKFA